MSEDLQIPNPSLDKIPQKEKNRLWELVLSWGKDGYLKHGHTALYWSLVHIVAQHFVKEEDL